jgi:hypothetical protein
MNQQRRRSKIMKKMNFVLSLFAAGVLVLFGTGQSLAGDLKVSGFADIILTLMDESSDDATVDSDGESANSTERKTGVSAEVDFEYTEGPVTFRLDLDIPSIGNEATGLTPVGDIGVEQAKFVWAIPGGDPFGLSLTGGAFNAPIGFEAQDAPDLYQTSNGQLFALVPSNLAGFMATGGVDMVSLDVYFANDWRGTSSGTLLGEENSIGGLLTVTPIEQASLAVGYITSPEVDPAVGATDENVLDIVVSGTITPMEMVNLLLAGEFLTDENNTAFAVVANLTHNTPTYPHGLTVRFDSVDCDEGSFYCTTLGIPDGDGDGLTDEATPTSITVAAFVALADNLSALLEWKTFDPDASGLDETDMATLEFVATF